MAQYLVFRLYGPMASWGDVAVGETRPTFGHPGKSAVMGLLAAALGIDRDQEEAHVLLDRSYGLAVRVDRPGLPLKDYHTTQTATQAALKRLGGARARYRELEADDLVTILSSRDYLAEALYTVFLWPLVDDPPHSPAELAQALERPRYHLYLGRKSCPLALPAQARLLEAPGLAQALAAARFDDGEFLEALPERGGRKTKGLYWQGAAGDGLQPFYSYPRRDAVHSRRRWQFQERREHYRPLDENG